MITVGRTRIVLIVGPRPAPHHAPFARLPQVWLPIPAEYISAKLLIWRNPQKPIYCSDRATARSAVQEHGAVQTHGEEAGFRYRYTRQEQ